MIQLGKRAVSDSRSGGQRVWLGASVELARAVLGGLTTGSAFNAVAFLAPLFVPVVAAAALGFVLSILGGWVWLGLVCFLTATLMDAAATRGQERPVVLLHRLLADNSTRTLLYGVAFSATLARAGAGIAATASLSLATVVFGSQLVFNFASRWLGARRPPLRYVPGAQAQERSLQQFAQIYLRSYRVSGAVLVILGVGMVAIALAWQLDRPWWAVAAAGVAGVACAGTALVNLARARRLGSPENVERLKFELMTFLDELKPTFVIYMSAGAGQSKYILNQWIPPLERVPGPGFIIVRETTNLASIQETSLPVVLATKTRHVEELIRPSVRVAYYLANAGKNVHLLREAGLKHVFLNHGDSDKSTSANPVARVYDEVWVAGQAGIDRYEAAGISIPPEKYAIVGRPQMAPLAVGPVATKRPTILYAPTFEGYYEESNYSSLEVMGPQMIRRLLEEFPDARVIFKPHPNTGVQRPGMAAARMEIAQLLQGGHGEHLFVDASSSVTLYQAFDQADALISDISSVVTDFLYTERPIVISNPRGLDRETFMNTFPTQRASYLLERDLSNFSEIVSNVLGPDPMGPERLAMKHYVLGNLPQGPEVAFIQEAERVTRDAESHRATIKNLFRVGTSSDRDDSDDSDGE